MISSATKAKLSYDSAVWLLKDTASDPGAAAEDPNCKEGNLWLGINPDYGGGDPSADTVIFDFNLPGKEAIVYTGRTPGTTISLPSVSNESTGAVTYKFRGWYTEPVGGSKLSDPLTVEAGTHVYYAQWDVQTDSGSGGGGVPGDADMYLVYFDQNYEGGGLTTAYVTAGTFSFTVEFEGPDGMETEVVEVDIPFEFPGDPARDGYTFRGWGTSADSNSPVDQGSWAPTEKVTTLYGIWEPDTYTLTWDANGGNGGTTTTQERDSIVVPPSTTPTREGYDFTGWYLDQDCTTPLVSGTVVKQSATYYAGWTPKEYTITWDTNYTNGSVTTIQQKYDDELNILPDPIRTGYEFGGWYTEPNGGGTRAEAYGTVKGNETFYANWVQESIDYTVTIEWDDDSDNDAVRPESITVELTRNDLPTGMTYTFTEADADGSGNKWSHTFTNLPKTDSISQEYTYSVAITSSVSDEYSYGIENKSATLGYILMTHTLITRDVNTYIVWDDAKDQDGQRPAAVQVQLCANGKPVEDAEASTTLAGDGDTWSYTFEDFQKYYTTDDGEKGQEIVYTIEVTPVTPGELDAYTIEYSDYTAILHHELETVTRQVVVEWADNNNQDGKRPASMVVQLYADNVPMPGKSVVLSDANKWTYTWSDLPKYSTAGKEVAYSAHVTSTLVDYTAATTEMTIEMTYVPSSTTISAFATWEDGEDVDGLRPETLTVELYADGEPTGDRQVISVDTGWTVSWSNYPIYKDGSRIEYTFQIVDVPDGYDAEYYGIYDTSGLSVLLTHNRILANQEVTITWDDQDNAALARPAKVEVMLYADGVPLTDQTAIITEADGWAHTFEGRPVYRDGGVPIKYSAYVVSAVGEYIPSTDGLHITMGYEVETVDIPLSIIWDDDNDRDGQRPVAVVVTLTIDGEPTAYQSMATEENGWTVLFEGFAAYAQSDKGHKINYGVVVTEPKGYTATYAGSTCLLTYAPETTSATPILYWRDNNDQYGQRPGKVTVSLLADGQPTGKTVQVYAADNWTAQPFTNLPRYDGQREIVYSINVTGELSNYTVTVDGMNAYLTHNATGGEEYTRDYTATVTWADNEDALGSRPDSIKMTLYADGAEYDTYTMTAADAAGGQNWVHTFTDLPTKQSGKTVTYSIGIEALPNYAEQIEGPSITMVHSEDVVVTVRWADNNNQDGQRPEELTLRLLADKLDAGRTATLAGDSEADTWVLRMDKVPVWSTVNTGREIDYTYLLDAASASSLEAAGYSVQYNGYELGEGSEIGGTLLYTLDLSRDAEIADYTATVTWDDDTDRDGQRPESLTVELYADGESTGLTAEVTGGNEAESWNHVFEALPVYADQGNVIVYTLALVGDAPSGYTVVPDETTPAMELKHEISRTDVTATVTWDHKSDINGLEPIDLYVELTVDGVATGEVAKLTAANNWSYTWPGRYVYHDHGTAYEYSFIVSEQSLSQLPDGVEVVVDGTEGTVIHSILALFCLLELYRCSVQADGAASGTTFSLEIVGKAMLHMILAKIAVDSTQIIMEAVYQVSQHITLGISSIVSSGSVSSGLDLPAVIDEINGMGTGEQIGMLIELVIVKFGVLIILGIVNVICIGRFIEIYVMIAIAPIPIATLPSQELSSIGKNFFKSFAAVCVQGILIYLVVSFFPVLISNDILGDSSVFGMLLYSLVLGVSVLSCGRWAKSICNAF